MSHKIFDNNLVAIHKNINVTFKLNKPAYTWMCILELSKVSIYEFHYDCIKNKYGNNSRLLFTDTNSLMYETENVYKVFSNDKDMFDFSNYSTKSKYYDNSKKLMVGKMKDESAGVAIEEFLGLKPKMYSYLVDDNSKYKKVHWVNKNFVVAISHNEYKALNKKCLRYWMNRTHSKDHGIGTYEINKISLSCFVDKIYMQINGCNGLALGY